MFGEGPSGTGPDPSLPTGDQTCLYVCSPDHDSLLSQAATRHSNLPQFTSSVIQRNALAKKCSIDCEKDVKYLGAMEDCDKDNGSGFNLPEMDTDIDSMNLQQFTTTGDLVKQCWHSDIFSFTNLTNIHPWLIISECNNPNREVSVDTRATGGGLWLVLQVPLCRATSVLNRTQTVLCLVN